MKRIIVVAFGGNALLRSKQKGSYQVQLENVRRVCEALADLVADGSGMVIGHGNGPQVGNVMLQQEAGNELYGLEIMPMDFCVAETQGSIGYLIELGMRNALIKRGIHRSVATLTTEVVVDLDDPMFANPTKPVGPYFTHEEADKLMAAGHGVYRYDEQRNGWRKVVASPFPQRIINIDIIRSLSRDGCILVAAGGGGIPVADNGAGELYGVNAVIDKDLATAKMAVEIGATHYYVLTDVPKLYINFCRPDQKALDVITLSQAEEYLAAGEFGEGTMAPKIRAALYFVRNSNNGQCVVTDANELSDSTCGTRIIKD